MPPVAEADSPCGGLGAGPVTLETFGKLLALLSGQLRDMEALPPARDIGAVRVDAQQLRAALLPWPERRLREMREMLPSLAGGAFAARQPECTAHCATPAASTELVARVAAPRPIYGHGPRSHFQASPVHAHTTG